MAKFIARLTLLILAVLARVEAKDNEYYSDSDEDDNYYYSDEDTSDE